MRNLATQKSLQRKSRPVVNPKRMFKLERKNVRYYKVFVKGVSQISDDLGGLIKDDVFKHILMTVIFLQFHFMKKK